MTLGDPRQRLTQIEWLRIEFKRAQRSMPNDASSTVSAFANTGAGHIILGASHATVLFQQELAALFSKAKVFYKELPTRRPGCVVVPTPTFVMSFDAVVTDAECRNHTFLEILKSGMKALAKSDTPVAAPPAAPLPAAAPLAP
jgi:hypothetical protein